MCRQFPYQEKVECEYRNKVLLYYTLKKFIVIIQILNGTAWIVDMI